jgi:hypothetical protein
LVTTLLSATTGFATTLSARRDQVAGADAHQPIRCLRRRWEPRPQASHLVTTRQRCPSQRSPTPTADDSVGDATGSAMAPPAHRDHAAGAGAGADACHHPGAAWSKAPRSAMTLSVTPLSAMALSAHRDHVAGADAGADAHHHPGALPRPHEHPRPHPLPRARRHPLPAGDAGQTATRACGNTGHRSNGDTGQTATLVNRRCWSNSDTGQTVTPVKRRCWSNGDAGLTVVRGHRRPPAGRRTPPPNRRRGLGGAERGLADIVNE